MAFAQVVDYGPADGATFGKDTSAKISFYGVAPVTQPASASQAALTATTGLTAGVAFSTTTAFSAFVAQVEEIRASLVELGLLKGSA
jgi:hypothetical protein